MKSCAKFLIIAFLSVIVQASPKALEDCSEIKREKLNLEVEISKLKLEISQLKLEISLLKSENFHLSEQNCTGVAESVDVLSKNLVNIQQELGPLSEHFHLNKTNTDPNEGLLIKTLEENQKVMSESFNSLMKEMTYLKQQVSAIPSKIDKVEETVQSNNLLASLKTYLNEFKNTQLQKMPKNCAEAAKGKVGVFEIEIPDSKLAPFPVYCDWDDWMVFLRRVDGTVDFDRNWNAFKEGFGEITGNFMMGLEKLHQVTKSQCHELKVVLEDFKYDSAYALYDQFGIDDESNSYALKTLGEYSGTAGDSLTLIEGMKFSTKDLDNDESISENCAAKYKAGWWHKTCKSQLTGKYHSGGVEKSDGINWYAWKESYYSYKSAKMMIRPTTC